MKVETKPKFTPPPVEELHGRGLLYAPYQGKICKNHFGHPERSEVSGFFGRLAPSE
jgi:hypothetical protein